VNTPTTQAAKPKPKETALRSDKLPQIFRRLEAIGFKRNSDGRYVNSNSGANIQEIAYGHDRLEDDCVWLSVTARKTFAYASAASERFAQRRQAKRERDLRLAKRYWLETIQPFIKDGPLRGAELFVATNAFFRLRKAQDYAAVWNATEHGQCCPVPAESLVDWNKEEFREPEELYRDENLKPETLAAIAAPMMQRWAANLPPIAIIGVAHELLLTAKRYIGTLPEQKRGTEQIVAALEQAFSSVTFAEIAASIRKDSGKLPLLWPSGQKRKNVPEQEQREKPLSIAAIREAVRHHLKEHTLRPTQEEDARDEEQTERLAQKGNLFRVGTHQPRTYQEWQRDNQRTIDECMKNGRVSLQDLCDLRWERFARTSETRKQAAVTRNKKRQKTKEKTPSSAASSPQTAGKREKPKK